MGQRVTQRAADFHKLFCDGSLSQVESAIRNGADLNAPGQLGETAAMIAVKVGDFEKLD